MARAIRTTEKQIRQRPLKGLPIVTAPLCGGRAIAPRRLPAFAPLGLLAKRVMSGLALLPCCKRRRGGAAAFLLLVVFGLRLLLFLVASHLTFRHGVLPAGCSWLSRRILAQLPWTTRWSLSFF